MIHKGAYTILLFTLFALGSAHAESPVATKPAFNPATPRLTPVKPLNAANGPGTQTEDDIYVGVKPTTKRQVQGVNTPGVLQIKPSATTSPNTGNTNRTGGDDDDLDDLEVERRKVEGVNMPNMGAPQPKSGAGTSPNTGRSSGLKP